MNEHYNSMGASDYDAQREKLAPLKDALHLCMQLGLDDLPTEARILCVGAGTGAELLSLALANPQWLFTVVEPAPAMFEICQQQAKQNGILSRCTFHNGYLTTLPDSEKFNAATSILVSHFVGEFEDRINYYTEIANRLLPGAALVNADLSTDLGSEEYASLLKIWIRMHKLANMPFYADTFGKKIMLLPRVDIENILMASGFKHPVLFYQSLFIHAWYSTMAGEKTNK